MAKKSRIKKGNTDFVLTEPKNKSKLLVAVSAKNVGQKKALKAISENQVTFLYGCPGTGKSHCAVGWGIQEMLKGHFDRVIFTRPYVEAGEKLGFLPGPQPLSANILTPLGWTTMGELRIGDFVIGRDGKPTKVKNIFPKGKKEVYEILTTDGTVTECCIDHLWYTKTFEDRKRERNGCVKTTQEILETLYRENGKPNHFLPRNEAVHFQKQKLSIPPYLLGVLLGDGCFSNVNKSVSFSSLDKEIIDRASQECEELNCILTKQGNTISYNVKGNCSKCKPARKIMVTNTITGQSSEFTNMNEVCDSIGIKKSMINYRCNHKNTSFDNLTYEFMGLEEKWANPIKNKLAKLNLLGCKAKDKFIPNAYKFSSIEDRLNILRGLMDTDGHINKKGCAGFTTTSKQLAIDVVEIVRSLGGRASLRSRKERKPSVLRGKFVYSRHKIYDFTISLPLDMNPFYIYRKSSRFISNYIHGIGIVSIKPVGIKEVQCISVESNENLYITDQYIVTHNSFDAKMGWAVMPLYEVVSDYLSQDDIKDLIEEKKIIIYPIAYMRGATFKNAYVIADEMQNSTVQQMRMILTRIGEGSKVVCTGDVEQSDLGIKLNGLLDAIKRLNGIKGLEFVELGYESCVREKIVSDIDMRYKEPPGTDFSNLVKMKEKDIEESTASES